MGWVGWGWVNYLANLPCSETVSDLIHNRSSLQLGHFVAFLELLTSVLDSIGPGDRCWMWVGWGWGGGGAVRTVAFCSIGFVARLLVVDSSRGFRMFLDGEETRTLLPR